MSKIHPSFHLSALLMLFIAASFILFLLGFENIFLIWGINLINLCSLCWSLYRSVKARRRHEQFMAKLESINSGTASPLEKMTQIQQLRSEIELGD